jgi:mannose-6-phosphate isomerase
MTHTDLYPLLLTPKVVSPIWGGTRLASWLDVPEPRPATIGETWQVYDSNVVRNGALVGQALADLVHEHGAALVGSRSLRRYGADFPLLAKFIDAADRLSIQVHPNDEYAHRVEAASGFHGKTEAWYIVDAAPGATVTYGFVRDTDRDEVAAALVDGTIEQLTHAVSVSAGDTIFVPAGTLHAINAGILLFEIQQKSDLTYRVFDYGRRDAKTGQLRALHIDKSLEVLDYGAARPAKTGALSLGEGRALLVACPYFALERFTIAETLERAVDPGSFEILTVLHAAATLRWAGGELPLKRGESVLLPSSLGAYTLHDSDEQELLQVLCAYVPDIPALRERLLALGLSRERIAETVFDN